MGHIAYEKYTPELVDFINNSSTFQDTKIVTDEEFECIVLEGPRPFAYHSLGKGANQKMDCIGEGCELCRNHNKKRTIIKMLVYKDQKAQLLKVTDALFKLLKTKFPTIEDYIDVPLRILRTGHLKTTAYDIKAKPCIKHPPELEPDVTRWVTEFKTDSWAHVKPYNPPTQSTVKVETV